MTGLTLDIRPFLGALIEDMIRDDVDHDVDFMAWMLERTPEQIEEWKAGENITFFDLERLAFICGYPRGAMTHQVVKAMAVRCSLQVLHDLEHANMGLHHSHVTTAMYREIEDYYIGEIKKSLSGDSNVITMTKYRMDDDG